MKDELCQAFCDNLQVRQVPAGLAVSTGFLSSTGDRIGFYVRQKGDAGFRVEDNGFVLPSLEASGLSFQKSASRAGAMNALLSQYGVSIDQGSRSFAIDGIQQADLPAAAMRFVAFILRVEDFALMSETRVSGTFREDVARMLSESIGGRAKIEQRVAIGPALPDFTADFVIKAANRKPVGVFLGTSDARILEAVIVQMRAIHEVKYDCSIVALLESGRSITANVRRNATNRLAAVTEYRGDEVASIQRIVHEAIGSTAVH
jgi:hypothetical protein